MSPRDIQSLRASDADRESVVALLGDHHEEGRLGLDEFQDRVSAAYKATTIGQLKNLIRDLPASSDSARAKASAPRSPWPQSVGDLRPRPFGELTDGQKALRVLWTIWTAAVSINVVVWFLASLTHGGPMYFWPAWVAGPSGAVLGSVSWFARGGGRRRDDEQTPW